MRWTCRCSQFESWPMFICIYLTRSIVEHNIQSHKHTQTADTHRLLSSQNEYLMIKKKTRKKLTSTECIYNPYIYYMYEWSTNGLELTQAWNMHILGVTISISQLILSIIILIYVFFFKFFVVFLIVAASRWWRSALGASRQRCHRGLRRCRSQHRRSWIDGQIQGWRTDRRRTTGRSRKSPTILEQRKHRQCWRFVSFSAFMLFQIIQNINCCCFFF